MKDKIAGTAAQQITTLVAEFTQVIMLVEKFLRIHRSVLIVIIFLGILAGVVVVILGIHLQDILIKIDGMFGITLSPWSGALGFSTARVSACPESKNASG